MCTDSSWSEQIEFYVILLILWRVCQICLHFQGSTGHNQEQKLAQQVTWADINDILIWPAHTTATLQLLECFTSWIIAGPESLYLPNSHVLFCHCFQKYQPTKSCLCCAKQHTIELEQRRLISWAAASSQYCSAAPGPAPPLQRALLCTPQTAQPAQSSVRSSLGVVIPAGNSCSKLSRSRLKLVALIVSSFRQGGVCTDLSLVYICFHVMASVFFLSSIKYNCQMN